MTNELGILLTTAVTIGFVHTVIGPDHYLPFIVMARSGRWSPAKTSVVTFLCGLGHVLSSIVLGFVGVALGLAVGKLTAFESARGEIAGWLLLSFGFAYFVWGLHRAIRNKPHKHFHLHEEDDGHSHEHAHTDEHTHAHEPSSAAIMTPWILFTIFVFGPCEPLIPILMYPAAQQNMASVALVAGAFGLTTIATMMAIVLLSYYGLARFSIRPLERYSHAMAGLAIFLCGGAIKFLGL